MILRYLRFAKIPAGPLLWSSGARPVLCADSLSAKSNRAPGTRAPEPPFAGRICLQHRLGMIRTPLWEHRLMQHGNYEIAAQDHGKQAARLSYRW